MMLDRRVLLSLGLLCSVAAVTLGQPQDKRRFAITDATKADEDFAIQGEYLGTCIQGGAHRQIGLQVVARGDGRFDAVQFLGGLPGAGWNHQERTKLSGSRRGDQVVLEGESTTISIVANRAAVRRQEQLLGHLPKVQRISRTLGAAPPAGAVVIFDGSNTDQLQGGRINDEGLLMVGPTTKFPVQDFRLHLEFRTPYMPYAKGQQRGNSGVYIQRRYEVQILDSFGLDGLANECGGLYRQSPPDVNMCLPPLSWQTYDIDFRAARWDSADNKIQNAAITVYHNGVAIHHHRELPKKTGAGRPETPEALPIHLQNHGNPVAFRNIWLVHYAPPQTIVRYQPAKRPRGLLPKLFPNHRWRQ